MRIFRRWRTTPSKGHRIASARLLYQRQHLVRQRLMRCAGPERFLNAGDVMDLRDRGDHEHRRIGQTARAALVHSPDGGRTGPAFVVHRAFRLADAAHTLRERQLLRFQKCVLIQRQLRKLPLKLFAVDLRRLLIIRFSVWILCLFILHGPAAFRQALAAKESRRAGEAHACASRDPGRKRHKACLFRELNISPFFANNSFAVIQSKLIQYWRKPP